MVYEYLNLDRIQSLYKAFVSNVSEKKHATVIASASALVLVYYAYDRIIRPPRALRNIPHIGYFDFIKSSVQKEPLAHFSKRLIMPILEKNESNGVYMRPNPFGWAVYITQPEAIKTLLLKIDVFPKVDVVHGAEGTLGVRFTRGPNLVFLNGPEWRKQRRIATPAFRRSLPVQLFGNLTQTMFKTMETMDSTINVTKMMERWTLDAIGKAAFGFDFHAIEDDNGEWVVTYNNIMNGHVDPWFVFFPQLEQKFLWMFPKRQKIHEDLTRFLHLMDNLIENKRKEIKEKKANFDIEDNEKDLLQLLIEGEEEEGILTNEELKANFCLFFVAGHDTTANALAFILYYLAIHQDIQQKARDEIIRILGDEPTDVLPTIEDTKEMTYLNMVMKESMRATGPTIEIFPRRIQKDMDICGTFIPKGTLVSVDVHNMHHSPHVWQNPEKFDPERFAPGGEAEEKNGMAWIPFSNGGRQCIGMNFSLAEQRVVLSMMLRKYTWTLPENSAHKDGLLTTHRIIQSAQDLEMTFVKRY
ncbi:cytochrome P450-dit2 [Apophysomyces sp. BC1034]|nr:cytochrome P450-dit2 [Apophysomyces sp. BC1015]KAG0174148.1 cytochrome P450-dit2 [Apophysomyces sp. BC1021]KAG0185336.1 cytochrome P450-dit2 [Apophysomyces sp. BC1034]